MVWVINVVLVDNGVECKGTIRSLKVILKVIKINGKIQFTGVEKEWGESKDNVIA